MRIQNKFFADATASDEIVPTRQWSCSFCTKDDDGDDLRGVAQNGVRMKSVDASFEEHITRVISRVRDIIKELVSPIGRARNLTAIYILLLLLCIADPLFNIKPHTGATQW